MLDISNTVMKWNMSTNQEKETLILFPTLWLSLITLSFLPDCLLWQFFFLVALSLAPSLFYTCYLITMLHTFKKNKKKKVQFKPELKNECTISFFGVADPSKLTFKSYSLVWFGLVEGGLKSQLFLSLHISFSLLPITFSILDLFLH